MGIPKFYRWLSERYPLLNQPVTANGAPELDNLYLDMNGIIHNCTHANADAIGRVDEERMMCAIIAYIDHLVRIVKPRKLLYMAIDGVAPRAKMNQQRSRRFRSARDAAEAVAAAKRRGEEVPEEDQRFDSNCITPGTEFMAHLSAHLHFMIQKKQTEDPLWQACEVVLSGPEVPGEGEHKIMERLRWARLQPDWTEGQRHCLYGLDADLIMLALVTHQPHFCLLREVVDFGKGGRGQPSRDVLANPAEESFVLFQIGLLRQYLELEFQGAQDQMTFTYDLERVVDDFVLLCMLVGNDFLPGLPTLDIAEGALGTLFEVYRLVLPTLGGYLHHAGDMDLTRLEQVLHQIGLKEAEVLAERASQAEEFAARKKDERSGGGGGRSGGRGGGAARGSLPRGADSSGSFGALEDDEGAGVEVQGGAAAAAGTSGSASSQSAEGWKEVDGGGVKKKAEPEMMSSERRRMLLAGEGGLQAWRHSYYTEKHQVEVEAGVKGVAHHWVRGLLWTLHYYYRGVADWTWFYPYHYAPLASDLTDLHEVDRSFTLGRPFLPFWQLLAVLPSASGRLLPASWRALMQEPHSPLLDFYPQDFLCDHEGKRNEWEAVVLVPFIQEDRLVAAINTLDNNMLTQAEKNRNRLGDVLTFTYDPTSTTQTPSTLPNKFSALNPSLSACVARAPLPALPEDKPGFQPLTPSDATPPPGFPTLTTRALQAQHIMAGVNVFGQPSRKESLILKVQPNQELPAGIAAPDGGQLDAEVVAAAVIGRRCQIGWPFLTEALVTGVSDVKQKIEGGSEMSAKLLKQKSRGGLVPLPHSSQESQEWSSQASRVAHTLLTGRGLDVGRVELLLQAHVCVGLTQNPDGSLVKSWSTQPSLHPLQVCLQHPSALDPRLAERGPQSAGALFPVGTRAVCLAGSYYGQTAQVLACEAETDTLVISVPPARNLHALTQRILQGGEGRYLATSAALRVVGGGLSGSDLGTLTSSLKVHTGETRVDLGLNLKHGPRNLCVPDYTRAASHGGKGWEYSDRALKLIKDYIREFPWVVRGSRAVRVGDTYSLGAFLPGMEAAEAQALVHKAREWLKNQDVSARPLVDASSVTASQESIRNLQATLPTSQGVGGGGGMKEVVLEGVVKELLLPPLTATQEIVSAEVKEADSDQIPQADLGDRVVAVVEGSGRPPRGSQGTVVGVHKAALEVLFDQPFIGGNTLQGRCNGACGAFLKASDLLNITASSGGAGGGGGSSRSTLPPPTLSSQPNVWQNGSAVDHLKTSAKKKSKPVASPVPPPNGKLATNPATPVPPPITASAVALALRKPRPDPIQTPPVTSDAPAATVLQEDDAAAAQGMAGLTLLAREKVGPPPLAPAPMNPGAQPQQQSHLPQAAVGVEDPAELWSRLSKMHSTEAALIGGWGGQEAPADMTTMMMAEPTRSDMNGADTEKKTRNRRPRKSKPQADAQPVGMVPFTADALPSEGVTHSQVQSGSHIPKTGESVQILKKKKEKQKASSVASDADANAPKQLGQSELDFWAMLTKS